jgi:hypothetical protein
MTGANAKVLAHNSRTRINSRFTRNVGINSDFCGNLANPAWTVGLRFSFSTPQGTGELTAIDHAFGAVVES